MKIEKVTYQKTYSIGPYLTDRIGMEASVDEGESAADVLDNLRGKADEWHKAEHPHLYQEPIGEPYIAPQKYEQYTTSSVTPVINVDNGSGEAINTMLSIQSATTIEELTTFKLIASKDPQLYTAYMQKLKDLNHA